MRVVRKPGKREVLKQVAAQLSTTQGRIGWFESAKYGGGQPVAGVAAVHEFGSPERKIPPRLGMRATAAEKQGEWRKTAEHISRAAFQGAATAEQVVEAVTMAAEGHVRETIAKVTSPALKESTVAARKRRLAKGSKVGGKGGAGVAGIEKPLVASGLLLDTLSSETVKK